MFGLSYLKLGGIALVLAAVAWHGFGDWKTSHELDTVRQELAASKAYTKQVEADLISVTQDAVALRSQVKEGDEAREAIRRDLQAKLDKVRRQPAPAECRAAVQWVRENQEALK